MSSTAHERYRARRAMREVEWETRDQERRVWRSVWGERGEMRRWRMS